MSHHGNEKLWFKRKTYGWGWVPVTWEGWTFTILYVGALVLLALAADKNLPPVEAAFTFVMPVGILTALLIRLCYAKGEAPRWQWGPEKHEENMKQKSEHHSRR